MNTDELIMHLERSSEDLIRKAKRDVTSNSTLMLVYGLEAVCCEIRALRVQEGDK